MADVLKEQFSLLSLQIALRFEAGVQKMDLQLDYYGRDDALLKSWTLDAAGLQFNPEDNLLSSVTTSGPAQTDEKVRFSAALIQLAADVAEIIAVAEVPASAVLWIHLVKPYGWLGTLPWEAALEQTTQRVVLRLPDFLERPQENHATLDVVICCDLPDGPDSVTQIERVIRAALDGSPRTQSHILVFAQAGNSRELRSKFKGDSHVWVAPSPSPAKDRDRNAPSPWLASIEQALRERAADAVHFICRASVVGGRASLRLAEPGSASAPAPLRFHSAGEISAFLTRIGAWAAIFTQAKGEADNRMRWFADTLAQTRPGAVLFDGDGDLAPLYHFLFAPSATSPPRLGSGFMYCQPSLAMPDEQASSAMPLENPAFSRISALGQNAHLFREAVAKASEHPTFEAITAAAGKVISVFPALGEAIGLRAPTAPSGPGATPTWLAAAQRYVEAQSLEIVRSRSKDPFLRDLVRHITQPGSEDTASKLAQADAADVVDKTLNELQSIIAKNAAKGD
jgi:hypothetical protein